MDAGPPGWDGGVGDPAQRPREQGVSDGGVTSNDTWMVEVDEEYVEAERLAVELLRKSRRDRGLTQTDLADEMALRGFRWSQPTVARVENGRRPLALAEARALMDILEQNEATAYRRINRI
jgi:hypothetical protein